MDLRIPSRFSRTNGQITHESLIGQWIYLLSQLDEVTQIVEIGAWRGGGSTKLIAQGMSRRSSPSQALCLEADSKMFEEAQMRHRGSKGVELLWGSLVPANDLDITDLSPEEKKWLSQDIAMLDQCPIVLDKVPEKIDLLIMDGGEFSGEAEFKVLEAHAQGWIVLDDTNTRKNSKVLQYLKGCSGFDVISVSAERNGVAIAKKL